MSDMPETIWATGGHYWPGQRHKRDKTEYRRADIPPTLSAAMELPEVKALVEAFKDQNGLMRSALEIAKREGINGEIGTTNWDAYYNKVAVSLKRSASALAAIKETKT